MKALLIVVVFLLVAVLVVDRVGVQYAEDRVAERLAEELALSATPGVQIGGFPVLTQAIAGSYDDVRLRVDAADLGELSALDVEVRLRGLQIPLADLFSQDVDTIPVESITGTVSIPYAEVAAQIGAGVTVAQSPDGVVVTQTLDILGEQVDVSGTGRIRVESSDQIVVTVLGLDLAGLEIEDSLIEQLQADLSFTYTVPPLPFGLRITDAVATADGFDVSAAAEDAVLAPL